MPWKRNLMVLFASSFLSVACGGGGDSEGSDPGGSDTTIPDPGTVDPGMVDPGASDPGKVDPGTSDPGPETGKDTPTETPADLPDDPGTPPVSGEEALAAVLAFLADELADEDGYTAWGPGAPLEQGTEIVTALGDVIHTTQTESWMVYVDPEPSALMEHEVHYGLVPTDGGAVVIFPDDMPPAGDTFAAGVVMVQEPVSAGTPTGWAEPDDGNRATGDYGDAPDDVETYAAGVMGGFPTHQAHDGAHVEGTGQLFLGEGLSVEMGADDPQDPDGIPNLTDGDSDDGLVWAMWKGPTGDWWHRAVVTVTVDAAGPDVQYLNLLADLDRDGTWDEPDDREWPIKNFETDVLPGSSKDLDIEVPLPPDALALDGAFWIRLALTKDPIADGWIGGGDLGDGEVEDYFIQVNDVGGGEEPLPPGPGGGPDPGPIDEVCEIDVHKRAIVIAGVDMPTKDHIVEGTANRMGKALEKQGFKIGPVVSGTPAQVETALKAFFAGTACLDEALIYFVAHGSAKNGGHMVFGGGSPGTATRWKASDVFALLKGLGACPGGLWLAGDCDVTGKACKQTILFEACHSGAFAGQLGQFEDSGDGRNVFFSSAAATPSWAINGMGVFSAAFLAALEAGKTPEEAFSQAADRVEKLVDKKVGKVQKPQKGASKPANCPCDCCGDGKVQKTQKVVLGVAQPQPVEDCDPAAIPDGCTAPEICDLDCQCGSTDPCGNGEVEPWETCDPLATPTGCPTGEACNSECVCEPCVPDCLDKECGSDGCNGQCPPGCTGQDACIDGLCVCQPACDDKQCGDDGCGGQCPPGCQGDQTCDANGQCGCTGESHPCGTGLCCLLTQSCFQNACCDPKTCDNLEKECGGPWDDQCGGTLECGNCTGQDACIDGLCVCQPACDDKQCGDDGCGGQCPPGCQGALMCNAQGQCACMGDTVQCGESQCCFSNQVCFQDACCDPKTCDNLEKECGGPWDDQCGGTLECGVCVEFENSFCDVDGLCDCLPGSCDSLDKECGGPYDDRCGGQTPVCGECPPKQACEEGQCTVYCGNGDCDDGEDCSNCESDCGCSELHECLVPLSADPYCCAITKTCEVAGGLAKACCSHEEYCDPGVGCKPYCGDGTCNWDDHMEHCMNCEPDCGCPTGQTCYSADFSIPACCPNAQLCELVPGSADIYKACCSPLEQCVDNECCSPKDCAAAGKQCGGPWSDGCGGEINCGECDGGLTCGETGLCEGAGPAGLSWPGAEGLRLEVGFDFDPDTKAPGVKPAMVVAGDGVGIFDLWSGAKHYPSGGFPNTNHVYGALTVPVTASSDLGGGPALSVFAYGPGTSWSQFIFDFGPGMTTIQSGNFTDGLVVPNGLGGQDSMMTTDYSATGWANVVETWSYSNDPFETWAVDWPAMVQRDVDFPTWTGSIISAWADDYAGPAFVLSDVGEVGWVDPVGFTVVDVGVVPGTTPDTRRIRCAGHCCIVTYWNLPQSATLKISAPDSAPALADTLTAGSGSVGAAILDLGDGTVETLTTGFNDATYTRHLLDADCKSLGSETVSLTADGCTGPGHGIYVPDDLGAPAFIGISCNTSGDVLYKEWTPVPTS